VRLASKLSGYELDVSAEPIAVENEPVVESKPITVTKLKRKEALESSLLEAIEEHGEES